MAATVSSPETPLLKKPKLDTDGDYCQTKEEYLISDSDATEEEDSRSDADDDADADTDTDTDTDPDPDPERRRIIEETLRKFANLRDMTLEEGKKYLEMVADSEGFDVPYFPNTAEIGQIQPILRLEDAKDELEQLTNMALEKYNEDNHSDYQLKKVVKANCEGVAGFIYYITFEATSAGVGADAELETFQARVWYGVMKRIEIELCRKKTAAQ